MFGSTLPELVGPVPGPRSLALAEELSRVECPALTARRARRAESSGAAQECWPYAQPFQAGQQITLTSSCNAASRWTALGTNQAPPMQERAGERG